MKLTKEECLKALNELKYLTATIENEYGIIEYNGTFGETQQYKVFEKLIEEYFKLVDEYKSCEFEENRFYVREVK